MAAFTRYDHVVSDSDQTLPIMNLRTKKSTFFSDTESEEELKKKDTSRRYRRSIDMMSKPSQKENVQINRNTKMASFPTTRSVLWDRRPTNVTDTIRTIDILPTVLIPPDLPAQLLQEVPSDGFLEGYATSIRHPSPIELRKLRLQSTRLQKGKIWDIPMHSQVNEDLYLTKITNYQLECQRCGASKTSAYIPITGTIRRVVKENALTFLYLETVVPECTVALTPIRALTFFNSPLSDLLLLPGPTDMERELQMGYLTMESTRKLVPLAHTDPLALHRPLVGIWISGLGSMSKNMTCHPYIWSMCVRYLHNNQVEERVAVAKNTFLLVLFPGPNVRQHNEQSTVPMFYECTISYASDDSTFGLFRSTIELTEDTTSSITAHFERGQVEAFQSAIAKQKSDTRKSLGISSTSPLPYTELETPIPLPRPAAYKRVSLVSTTLSKRDPPVSTTLSTVVVKEPSSAAIDLNQQWLDASKTKETIYTLQSTLDSPLDTGSTVKSPYHDILMAQQQQLAVLQQQIVQVQKGLETLSISKTTTPVFARTAPAVVDAANIPEENERVVVLEEDPPDRVVLLEEDDNSVHSDNNSSVQDHSVNEDNSESSESSDSSDESFEKMKLSDIPLTIKRPKDDDDVTKLSVEFDFPKIETTYKEEEDDDDDEELQRIMRKYSTKYGIA